MTSTIFPEITPVSNDGTLIKGIIVDRQNYYTGSLTLNWAAPSGTPSAATASVKVYSNTASSYSSPAPVLLYTLETSLDISSAGAETWNLDLSTAGRYIYAELDITFTGGTVPASIVSADFELQTIGIVNGLTTLASVKLEAGIATTDTSNDSLLETLINAVSSSIRKYLDREITRTTHTSERYSVNNCQMLYLMQYPVQSVSSVILNGVTQVSNTDYIMTAYDAEVGRLYRANGWNGNYYTRGTFPDIYAGSRDIYVTYISGWYLPADGSYVSGGSTSLPLEISYAANRAVISRYRMIQNQAEGLKALGEGGLNYTWFGPENFKASSAGFDDVVISLLNPFKRREFV